MRQLLKKIKVLPRIRIDHFYYSHLKIIKIVEDFLWLFVKKKYATGICDRILFFKILCWWNVSYFTMTKNERAKRLISTFNCYETYMQSRKPNFWIYCKENWQSLWWLHDKSTLILCINNILVLLIFALHLFTWWIFCFIFEHLGVVQAHVQLCFPYEKQIN